MKILFDSQIFDEQKYGGISRYYSELIRAFRQSEKIKCELPIRNTDNEYLSKLNFIKNKNIKPHFLSNIKGKFLLYKALDVFDKNSNRNLVIKKLKEQDFDIFHPTYYDPYFLNYLNNKKLVLTVYDMIHERFPKYFNPHKNKTIQNKKRLILKADKIIAISENTKRDIIKFYNVPEEKIKVIHLANSLSPVDMRPNNAPELPEKFILYVGGRSVYKNFIYFIESITPLLKKDPDLKLIVAGGYKGNNKFSQKEIKLFSYLNIENQIFQYSVNDQTLAYFYNQAKCFIFPSLYEGFGIPILEAFACSCPVLASNSSSLPELGGEAAIYFNPVDKMSILNAVESVVYNEDLRQSMILKGREQLKKFSWQKTAQETLSLYESIL